ncbi:MAG: hypothetical protein JST84_01065 [Acidobacteria bacterium]|nr:hypothetical protein [Acidobacteriota bacterium]
MAQSTPLPGQWTTTSLAATAIAASTTAKVRALVVSGTSIYAGTNSGIWRTTDNGTTWTQVNTGLATTDVRSMAVGGTTIYAGTNGGGVFRSTDGTNWTAINTGLTNLVVTALAANGTDTYAGTFGGGVFSLTNTTWKAVNTGLSDSAQVYSLTISGSDVLAGGQLVVNDPRHVFRSTDKGATWKATNATTATTNPPFLVYSIAVNGTTLLAASSDGLYRSTDSGTTWVLSDRLPLRVVNLLYVPAVSAFYASGVATDGSLYGVSVSTDNGATWRASSYGLAGANALAVSDTTLFAANTASDGVSIGSTTPITSASVSGADFRSVYGHAPESIATIFGTDLATGTVAAISTPLPTSLAGTTVTIKDSQGTERLAPLFFVSKGQVNYQVPTGTATGWAYVTVKSGDGKTSYATANVTTGAFSLFTADAMGNTGSGVPAAYIQRVRANGSQSIEPIGSFDGTKWVTVPIDLGPESDQVFLVLFGTGIRAWNNSLNPITGYFKLDAITYIPVTADYAGIQPEYVGVDQINLRLPRSLAGAGEISLYLTANTGPFSNTVKIRVL